MASRSHRRIYQGLFVIFCATVLYLRINPWVWPWLFPLIGALALWRGGPDERVVAIAFAISMAATAVAQPYDLATPRYGVMAVDVAFLAVIVFVALCSRRLWPSWGAAFQSLTVMTHLIYLWSPDRIEPWAYVSSVVIWSWLIMVALTFGVWDAWAERRQAPNGLVRGSAP